VLNIEPQWLWRLEIFLQKNFIADNSKQMHNGEEKKNDSFKNKFENLVKMGLPSALNDKGRLLSIKSYKKSLFIAIQNETKFQGMAGNLRGKTIVDLLINDFYLL